MDKAHADKAHAVLMAVFLEVQRWGKEKKSCEVVVRIPLSPEGTVGFATMSIEKIRL